MQLRGLAQSSVMFGQILQSFLIAEMSLDFFFLFPNLNFISVDLNEGLNKPSSNHNHTKFIAMYI